MAASDDGRPSGVLPLVELVTACSHDTGSDRVALPPAAFVHSGLLRLQAAAGDDPAADTRPLDGPPEARPVALPVPFANDVVSLFGELCVAAPAQGGDGSCRHAGDECPVTTAFIAERVPPRRLGHFLNLCDYLDCPRFVDAGAAVVAARVALSPSLGHMMRTGGGTGDADAAGCPLAPDALAALLEAERLLPR